MLPANSCSFTSSFNSIRLLHLLSLLHWLQQLALYRKSDKNGHSGFFLFLRENYSLLLVRIPLAIEEIPHYSCDSQSFHHNWLLNFCKSFFLIRLIWWYDSAFYPANVNSIHWFSILMCLAPLKEITFVLGILLILHINEFYLVKYFQKFGSIF